MSPFPNVGSVTKRIRVSSIGTNVMLANAPAHTAATRYASLLVPAPDHKERNMGLRLSYTPNFKAPSIPYPITVGPSPTLSADGPSSWMIFNAASGGEIFARAASLCIRVLTTSIGVVIPCDIAADAPPAMKNLGSAVFFFSSFLSVATSTLALNGGGSEIVSSPSETEGVVTVGVNGISSGSAIAKSLDDVAINDRKIKDELWRKARLSTSEPSNPTSSPS
mmetsp:Transcript_8896/g.19979  ORF Transcript_8896/g.19979 Transcript_8896/m.19979 type:complete len:222 (-) Transcript_8896:265-930(-)